MINWALKKNYVFNVISIHHKGVNKIMYIRKSTCGLCKPHKKVIKNDTKHKRRIEREIDEEIETIKLKLTKKMAIADFY